MNYSTTTPNDFTTLKNGIDERIEIIQHIDSGYYNITKTANLIAELKRLDSDEAVGYPTASVKPARQWITINSTKELIAETLAQTHALAVHYELKAGTPTQFAGTYVHELLYDSFLAWLDPKYAIKIAIILKQIHSDVNRKIIKEKDDAMEAFREEMRQRDEETKLRDEKAQQDREEARQRDERNVMLQQQILDQLSIAKADHMITHMKLNRADTKSDMYHAKNLEILAFVENLSTKANTLNTALIDKSANSTMNPEDTNLHHGSAITMLIREDGTHHVACIGGQEKHVLKQTDNHVSIRGRTVLVGFTPNANPIDYRNNVCSYGKSLIRTTVANENLRIKDVHAQNNIVRATRIEALEQRKLAIKERDNTNYLDDLAMWNNANRLRIESNTKLREEISLANTTLKAKIARHNLRLPRGSPLRKDFKTDPERRMFNTERIATAEEYRASQGLYETPPSRDDYNSGTKLEAIQNKIVELRSRMAAPPRTITELNIPVSFRPSVYTWKANPYISYDDFTNIFSNVLEHTQSSPIEYDPEELESMNFDGIDDLDLPAPYVEPIVESGDSE